MTDETKTPLTNAIAVQFRMQDRIQELEREAAELRAQLTTAAKESAEAKMQECKALAIMGAKLAVSERALAAATQPVAEGEVAQQVERILERAQEANAQDFQEWAAEMRLAATLLSRLALELSAERTAREAAQRDAEGLRAAIRGAMTELQSLGIPCTALNILSAAARGSHEA